MSEPVQTCKVCGDREFVRFHDRGFPPDAAKRRLAKRCTAAGHKCEPQYTAGVRTVTVPPPPAVPIELMRRAAEALRASLVFGARRDALTEAIEAIEALDPDDEGNGWGAAIDAATETLTVLRDATAPRGPLAATEPGQTPVPGIPGSPERAQGHSGPRGACRACSDYHRTGSTE